MAQRHSLTIPYGAPVLAISFLACVATGLELSINNHAADFPLSTTSGSSLSLSCLVHNSSQAENLLWYRGDGQVGLKDGNKVNISHICIHPVNESDNGVTFTCRLARDKSVQVSVTLDVKFPPQLSGEETLQIEEEKDVTLTCNSKSNPQAQTTWYKDNNDLTLQEGRYVLRQTSEVFQLSITKVQKSDNGTYTCVVESSLGKGTKDFHLIIEAKTRAQLPSFQRTNAHSQPANSRESNSDSCGKRNKKAVFPKEAVITAVVVVAIAIFFGIVARRDKFCKCFKKSNSETAL